MPISLNRVFNVPTLEQKFRKWEMEQQHVQALELQNLADYQARARLEMGPAIAGETARATGMAGVDVDETRADKQEARGIRNLSAVPGLGDTPENVFRQAASAPAVRSLRDMKTDMGGLPRAEEVGESAASTALETEAAKRSEAALARNTAEVRKLRNAERISAQDQAAIAAAQSAQAIANLEGLNANAQIPFAAELAANAEGNVVDAMKMRGLNQQLTELKTEQNLQYLRAIADNPLAQAMIYGGRPMSQGEADIQMKRDYDARHGRGTTSQPLSDRKAPEIDLSRIKIE